MNRPFIVMLFAAGAMIAAVSGPGFAQAPDPSQPPAGSATAQPPAAAPDAAPSKRDQKRAERRTQVRAARRNCRDEAHKQSLSGDAMRTFVKNCAREAVPGRRR
jgi:hypothetical protein